MCFTTAKDFCDWQSKDFKIDIFNKLATDEWQLCEIDGPEEGDPSETYICPTRYPGNV